jgi:RNA polymerase sigma-70 factor (ECF subfamily)
VGSVPEERPARYEALIGRVGEPLRRYTLRRLDPAAAEDALGEAFLVLWRRLDDVPTGPGELPWCYAVARNCVANERRAAGRRERLLRRVTAAQVPDVPSGEADPPDPELHAALSRLRSQDRELLRLWAWEDLAPSDIALALGTTTNAVNIRLHRARRRLAALLEAPPRKRTRPRGHEEVEGGRTP